MIKAGLDQQLLSWCPLLGVFRMERYKSIVSLTKEIGLTRDMPGEYFSGRVLIMNDDQ